VFQSLSGFSLLPVMSIGKRPPPSQVTFCGVLVDFISSVCCCWWVGIMAVSPMSMNVVAETVCWLM
jgi:hypothetical protein